MNKTSHEVLREIDGLPFDWHDAGPAAMIYLKSIAWHIDHEMGPIKYSLETGCGKTTLLLSHLSPNHTVFAITEDNSIAQVRGSKIFNPKNVTFVEGPTQRTIPHYNFTRKYQLVLLDGPHAYPFPDLEYYFIYPHIETGGLLLLDDINIPSVRRTFEIIKSDEMFELVDLVENMAFFRRTTAPLFDPYGDGWWLQGYNKPYAIYKDLCDTECRNRLREAEKKRKKTKRETRPFVLSLVKNTPQCIKRIIPFWIKNRMMQIQREVPIVEEETQA